MNIAKRSLVFKTSCIVLAVIILFPVSAFAVEPRASDYLTSYSAFTYSAGLGKIQVWFDVTADAYMDDIGALKIMIYESTDNVSWTWKETFMHDTTSGMLGHDEIYYSGHIDYQGVVGRYYKAYICIYAGRDGGGDNRYFWTNSVKATVFAQ